MFVAAITISRLQCRSLTNYENVARIKMFSRQYITQNQWHVGLQKTIIETQHVRSLGTSALNKSWICRQIHGWKYFKRQVTTEATTANGKVVDTNPLLINTNVKNNVMLFRFEKPLMYRIASIVAVFATIGCLTMAELVYKVLCKDLFNSEIPLTTRLYDHGLPLAAICIGVFAGPSILIFVWHVTIKMVKYIILHKGGKDVTIVTYHPIKGEVRKTMPLDEINCRTRRLETKGYISLKTKNYKFSYLVDKGGQFVNPELFDATVGTSKE